MFMKPSPSSLLFTILCFIVVFLACGEEGGLDFMLKELDPSVLEFPPISVANDTILTDLDLDVDAIVATIKDLEANDSWIHASTLTVNLGKEDGSKRHLYEVGKTIRMKHKVTEKLNPLDGGYFIRTHLNYFRVEILVELLPETYQEYRANWKHYVTPVIIKSIETTPHEDFRYVTHKIHAVEVRLLE